MPQSPDIDLTYNPRTWETYRRDAGCGCTAPAPVDCKIPHGTGAWLCVCHRLSGPPSSEPGKPLALLGGAFRQRYEQPNRCVSVDDIFRCSRPLGHLGAHRSGRIFWQRRYEDEEGQCA